MVAPMLPTLMYSIDCWCSDLDSSFQIATIMKRSEWEESQVHFLLPTIKDSTFAIALAINIDQIFLVAPKKGLQYPTIHITNRVSPLLCMVRHFVSSNQKFGEAESLLNQINVLWMNGIRSKIPVYFCYKMKFIGISNPH